MRTEIVHITRQRLTPSAAAPSVHDFGTARSASTMIAVMIGTIITARITAATVQQAPVSWTTYVTDSLRAWLMKVSATNGTITRIPISP